MKDVLKKFKNPGVILSVISLIIMVLVTNGVVVDNERIMTTAKALCSLGIILGVLNNPDTPGMDLPLIDKKSRRS